MTTPRFGQADALLASGRVLVTGGDSTGQTAELYGLAANGGTCTSANECASGVCDDGVCCSGPCNGTCLTCTAGTGACVAVKNAPDPDTCTGVNTCDAAGTCKLANGQTSATPSACASGFASDGVCCNTACDGACDACTKAAGAATNGTCAVVAQGSPGNPACGVGYVCDGVSATCPAPCVGDVDCATGYYCAANGVCTAQHAQGQACNLGAGADCKVAGCNACSTGHCVDGVCCDTACTTVCNACAASLKESGADGTCGPVAFDKPSPRSTCPTGSNACGPNGMCNGAGASLVFAPTGTACGTTACNGASISGSTCDGSGACVSGSSIDCAPYTCANSACATSCASDSDCVATAYCSKGGACVPKAALGTPCSASNECANGSCADGFCCNTACTGQCEACNVAGAQGTCTVATGAPTGGRPACGGAGTACGGSCDGKSRASCAYPDGADCGKSCSAGQETDMRCNSSGSCVALPPKACPNGIVACDGNACKASCSADSDCSAGLGCANGQCLPLVVPTCDGAHTITAPNGAITDCTPYDCESDHCKTTCASINDCADGNVCDPNGHCVPLSSSSSPYSTSAQTGSTGGCTLGAGGSRSTDGLAGFAIAALGSALARRRRRARSGA